LYGNTHSSASRTGHQSTSFRHESRQIIAEAVNAHVISSLDYSLTEAQITGKAAVDMVIFTGNGTTSAVNKLVHCLGLHLPSPDVRIFMTLPSLTILLANQSLASACCLYLFL
jgi:selenocysteine lyase/cysteine desulfurase